MTIHHIDHSTVADNVRRAFETKDLEALVSALSADVIIHSPVAYRPFNGSAAGRVLFTAVLDTYEDFRYVDTLQGKSSLALVFDARIGDRDIQGVQHVHLDPEGLVDQVVLMVRPLSGGQAFADVIGPKVVAGFARLAGDADSQTT